MTETIIWLTIEELIQIVHEQEKKIKQLQQKK